MRFHPEARAELRAAVEFYRSQKRSLGRELVGEMRAVVDRILELPYSGSPQETDLRRVVLDRFPFSVVYVHVEHCIEILAVIHHRRKPGYWRDRIA